MQFEDLLNDIDFKYACEMPHFKEPPKDCHSDCQMMEKCVQCEEPLFCMKNGWEFRDDFIETPEGKLCNECLEKEEDNV